VIDDKTAFRTVIGTPSYLAPEVGSDDVEQYTNAVDMWSLGCVLYWALTRATLFSRHNPTLLDGFVRVETPFPIQELHRTGVTGDAIDFLKQLVVVEPSARMSATMAFEHSWLSVIDSSGMQLERGIPRAKRIPDIRYISNQWIMEGSANICLERPRDVVIAVMGTSGVGKSTFISHFTSESLGSGDSLVSSM
jgi:serine/threonine protein kinase